MNEDAIDVLTDPRLSNIPAPDAPPTPDPASQKLLQETPQKYYVWELLGSIAAWGHASPKTLAHLCPEIPYAQIEPTLELMWQAGLLRRHQDCPKCQDITVWALRAGGSLKKNLQGQRELHRQGFFGELETEDLSTTDYCPPPPLCKHDLAASELAYRLACFLPEGWILGARDSRWSSLLRLPKPDRMDSTAFRQVNKTTLVERWGDLTYIRESDGLRILVEVTVSQNRSQLASKARWWGVSIAERGGPVKAGLRVVILDAPGKDIARHAVADAFPHDEGWEGKYYELGLPGVLTANWSDWISGEFTPAQTNGWIAYEHTGKRPARVNLLELDGGDPRWAVGIAENVRRRRLKGVFCSPIRGSQENPTATGIENQAVA